MHNLSRSGLSQFRSSRYWLDPEQKNGPCIIKHPADPKVIESLQHLRAIHKHRNNVEEAHFRHSLTDERKREMKKYLIK
jgi:hypothetical protein